MRQEFLMYSGIFLPVQELAHMEEKSGQGVCRPHFTCVSDCLSLVSGKFRVQRGQDRLKFYALRIHQFLSSAVTGF
ncbi:hypothetical protein BFF94_012800 [Burkholderia catarinensis]|nr:hypothetical protein BFF94_012800 [Burkholderia catarinensis]